MFKICLFLILCFCACESFKILVFFGFPGKSHVILGNELVKLLLDDGHEVTYITAGKFNKPRENLSLIDISDVDTFDKHLAIDIIMNNYKNLNLKLKSKMMSTQRIFEIWNATIQHSKVQEFLMDTSQQFNAVIVSWLYSEIPSGFAAVYQCPLIWFSSMEPDWSVLRLMDGIPNPAYSIDFVTDNVPPLTFLQRLEQLWVLIYMYSYHKIALSPQEEVSYRKAFSLAAEMRGVILPNLEEMKFNGSLMLGNSNAVISGDISLPQNYKHIGGYMIDDQAKLLLPENLQKILNESKHGFIYFSMGTRINTQQMSKAFKKDLIHMFGNLSYTVLWKFDDGDQLDLPPNVYIAKWVPQQSVLALPNIKLFITHGGLQSMIEAVHFGVPIIGIPGFADQKLNIRRASEKGFCILVDLSYDLAANLKLAIEEILGKANYKKAAERVSRIYHDKMVHPRKEISFWVRHIIENQNAQYLRSAALMVPWYQKIFFDIALVMLIGIIFITFMLRLLWKIGFGKNKEKLKLQ